MKRRKFMTSSILIGLGLLVPLPKAKGASLVLGSYYLDVPVSPSSIPCFSHINLSSLDGYHARDFITMA